MPLFDFDPSAPENEAPGFIVGAGGPWNDPRVPWRQPAAMPTPVALGLARALLAQPKRPAFPVAPIRPPRGRQNPLFTDLLRMLRGDITDPLF